MEDQEKKQYKPTKFGIICNRNLVSPIIANYIFLDLKNSGDIEAKIEGYVNFLEEIRLYGISNDKFIEGTYDVSNEDYKKFNEYKEGEL